MHASRFIGQVAVYWFIGQSVLYKAPFGVDFLLN